MMKNLCIIFTVLLSGLAWAPDCGRYGVPLAPHQDLTIMENGRITAMGDIDSQGNLFILDLKTHDLYLGDKNGNDLTIERLRRDRGCGDDEE
jgi:hypothetical protein